MPTPHSGVTVDRLLAVQRAFSQERQQQEIDILLDSIVVALSPGPLSESVLVKRVCEMWPGAKLHPLAVRRAAKAGVAAHVIVD